MKKLNVGDVFYDVCRRKIGNTTTRGTVIYRVIVTSVCEEYFEASWNGNRPNKHYNVPKS